MTLQSWKKPRDLTSEKKRKFQKHIGLTSSQEAPKHPFEQMADLIEEKKKIDELERKEKLATRNYQKEQNRKIDQ